jgi:hypothetical protein
MWFDIGLAGLFITSTLLHLGEDINSFGRVIRQTLLSNKRQIAKHSPSGP